ncbi:MAG: endonuclease/exonuclease/phosphatase family protein [Muribaculaceae bacterium]
MKRLYTTLAIVLCLMMGCANAFAATRLDVGTYNLRNNRNDDAKKGNGWEVRRDVVAQLLLYHEFDIFGTQECYTDQLEDLKERMPGYDYIGVGRDDGDKAGEYSAIFFRTDKFQLVESGNFWLNEHPDTPGMGWDAACVRICTWGHFRCRETGFEFLFLNLHMDHVGKVARVESAKLVLEKMREFGAKLPAILTGDFNVDQRHQSYAELVSSGLMKDSYEAAEMRYALNGTFNGFKPDNFTDSRIDHVMVSPSFAVKKYGVLTDTYRSPVTEAQESTEGNAPQEIKFKKFKARTPSDHFPVKVVLMHD